MIGAQLLRATDFFFFLTLEQSEAYEIGLDAGRRVGG
jgi:hypothetical protein